MICNISASRRFLTGTGTIVIIAAMGIGAGIRRLKIFWVDHRPYLTHPAFLGILGLKLLCGALFASHFPRDLFLPFIHFFIDSGFSRYLQPQKIGEV